MKVVERQWAGDQLSGKGDGCHLPKIIQHAIGGGPHPKEKRLQAHDSCHCQIGKLEAKICLNIKIKHQEQKR